MWLVSLCLAVLQLCFSGCCLAPSWLKVRHVVDLGPGWLPKQVQEKEVKSWLDKSWPEVCGRKVSQKQRLGMTFSSCHSMLKERVSEEKRKVARKY